MTDTRGMTLVEMMIAMVIVGIMGVALVGFLRAQHQTVLRQNNGVLATQNARAAVDMLARELRNAGYSPRGAVSGARIWAMQSDSVSWTADMNADGDTLDSSAGLWDERLAYYVQGSNLMRATPADGAVAVTDNVDSLRLAYFDGDGVATADPAVVEQVQIRLFYSTPAGVQRGVIESQVALRNNIYAN
ncbi:MAG TPA: prepilin-type N-terminal cleavage/methylation domain-containing protein [Gemmatimonadota bacterium]|nr:prepilin-type N-terminal cleavage/methylation domain-containing protein [Gemmatimonadota bacterium]